MPVPNYAYLKLKMPGPHDVIMMSRNFQNTYQCERDAVEYAEANNLDSGAPSLPCSMPGKKLLSMTLEQRPVSILDLSSSSPAPAPTLAAIIIGS